MESAVRDSLQTSTNESLSRKKQLQALEAAVAKFDLKLLRNVPYDGNCFFNAVSALVGGDGTRLRGTIADYVAKEISTCRATVFDSEFVKDLRLPHKEFEDSRACKAVADFLHRTVHVLTYLNNGPETRLQTFDPSHSRTTANPIHIGHIEDKHFVPLIKVTKRRVSRVMDESLEKKKKRVILDFFSPAVTSSRPDSVTSAIDRENASTETSTPVILDGEGSCNDPRTLHVLDHSSTILDPSDTLDGEGISQTHLHTSIDHDMSISPEDVIASGTSASALTENVSASVSSVGVNSGDRVDTEVEHEDIGFILNSNYTPEDAQTVVSSLTDNQKYVLLKRHFIPGPHYEFRSKFQNKCNRKCPKNFNVAFPWLVYSDHLDGVFCIHCALFVRNRNKVAQLVNGPYSNWSKFREKMEAHANTSYHREAMSRSHGFILKMERPNETIPRIVDKEVQKRVSENRVILKFIIKAILFCAKQGIALSGDNEANIDHRINPGNFLAYLNDRAEENEILKRHLNEPRMKNATYQAPQSQNEIIETIASFITEKIVAEIHNAIFYTIMADEVTSHNVEIMPLCIRYVDTENNIREEFLEFVKIQRTTGTFIANTIMDSLAKKNIPLENMRGQCYDGAANMSSDRCGVQRCILNYSEKAPYTRCNSHALNLVIVHSCKQTDITHTLDKIKSICIFYKVSPKREGQLQAIVSQGVQSENKRKAILDLCKTRWAERHVAFSHFYDSFVFIVESLESIAYGVNKSGYNLDVYDKWDAPTRSDAASYLQAKTTFSFIVAFMVLYQGLSVLSGISVQLQQKAIDVYDAYNKVDEVKSSYKKLRENIDDRFHRWYQQALRMADRVGTTPEMPRITTSFKHVIRQNMSM